MKAHTPARLRRPLALGTLALAGSLFVSPAGIVRAEDNGDNPITGDCPTWKTCDERCGATPPILDGSKEADEALDRYLECTNRCLREVFDCITRQVRAPVLDPDVVLEPVRDRGAIILPEDIKDLQLRVTLEPGQSVSSADTNSDERVDLSDALRVLNHLFVGGPPPAAIVIGGYSQVEMTPQLSSDGLRLIIDGNLIMKSGDADASGRLDLVDAMRILLNLFSNGQEPVEVVARSLPRPPPDDRLPDVPPIVIGRR
jgi:hypothetical protein